MWHTHTHAHAHPYTHTHTAHARARTRARVHAHAPAHAHALTQALVTLLAATIALHARDCSAQNDCGEGAEADNRADGVCLCAKVNGVESTSNIIHRLVWNHCKSGMYQHNALHFFTLDSRRVSFATPGAWHQRHCISCPDVPPCLSRIQMLRHFYSHVCAEWRNDGRPSTH